MSSEKKEKKQHKMNFNIKEKLKKTFSKEHLKEVFTGEEQKKHLKQGSYSSIMTVIVLAVIVVINLIVAQIPTSKTQIDLSTQKMYSITDETKTALKDLDQDVTLYYIVQKGSEDDTIEKLLEHYDELSDHIKVETKDPDLYPKFTSQYTDQTVAANSVIVVCGDKSKVVSNSDMWETSTNYQTYQTQTTGFDGEGQITSAITYVTSENNGSMLKYSPTSMFWLFNRVTNFAYLRYDRMSKDLQAVADRWENRVLGEVREVTAEARKLEGEARVKYVTDYSVMMAQTLFDLWKQMDEYLLVK